MTDGLTIRPFESLEDFRACVELQERTWGEGFSERVSSAILRVSQLLGGVSAGAFSPDGALVGFVFGMTGVRDGELVHWSDMLAVRGDARDVGLGRRLKLYQRERVLELGVEKMFWTFDPLQSRNAYLNVRRLGAVVREYVEDMYGASDSPLHQGIGTDRFVALWLLSSERVRERVALLEVGASAAAVAPPVATRDAARGSAAGPSDEHGPAALDVAPADTRSADTRSADTRSADTGSAAGSGSPMPQPGDPFTDLGNDRVTVAIPSDVGTLMAADMDLARAWREATRTVFTAYLRQGYEVSDFVRGGDVSRYVLTRRLDGESTDA